MTNSVPRYLIIGSDSVTNQQIVAFTWRGQKESGLAQANIDAAKFGSSLHSFRAIRIADDD